MALTLTPLHKIPLIKPGDPLGQILLTSLSENHISLKNGDILVVAQKIVSKCENRLVNLTTVKPGKRALNLAEASEKDPRFVELVLRESKRVMRKRPGTIIVEHKLGFVCANAGIDHSNVEGTWGNADDWVLLLPVDPDLSAEKMRDFFRKATGLEIGILIIDSTRQGMAVGDNRHCHRDERCSRAGGSAWERGPVRFQIEDHTGRCGG